MTILAMSLRVGGFARARCGCLVRRAAKVPNGDFVPLDVLERCRRPVSVQEYGDNYCFFTAKERYRCRVLLGKFTSLEYDPLAAALEAQFS